MIRYISGKPSIRLNTLFRKNADKVSHFPFDQKTCHFFFSARYALGAAIEALDMRSGDAVLLPSYNCGVEIDPFLYHGIKTVFYRIDKNLRIDLADMISKINRKVKAILVTHFLGFPQPVETVKGICAERGLFLIEDCAHALLGTYNGKPLGSYGDVSVFSLLKTLPVPNGGILVINNMKIHHNHVSFKPNLFGACFYALELLKHKTWDGGKLYKEEALNLLYHGAYSALSSARLVLAGFRKYFNPGGLYLIKPDSYDFIEGLRSWGTSGLSRKIISGTDFEEIKDIRRKNFEYFLSYFVKEERGLLPFTEIPPGVCPLFFPVILESARKREALYKALKEKGITSHPWWDRFHPEVPWKEYPEGVYLKERLFGLPVHQDLTYKHLQRIIEEFDKSYATA